MIVNELCREGVIPIYTPTFWSLKPITVELFNERRVVGSIARQHNYRFVQERATRTTI